MRVFSLFLTGISLFFGIIPDSYFPQVLDKETLFFFIFPFLFIVFFCNRKKFYFPDIPGYVFLIFFSAIISSLVFNIKSQWFVFYDFFRISGIIFIFFLLYQIFCDLNEKERSLFLKFIFYSSVIQKVIATFQITGLFRISGLSGRTAITGLLGNPNMLSCFLVLSGICSFILWKKTERRLFLADSALNMIFPFILFSRSAMIGVCVLIFLRFGWKACAASLGFFLPFSFIAGYRTVLLNNSIIQRLFIWNNSFIQFVERPFSGVGLGNFGNAFPYFSEKAFNLFYLDHIPANTYAMQSHNDILQFSAETGILGLISAGLFIWFIFRKIEQKDFFYGIIFLLIFSLTDFPFHNIPIAFLSFFFISSGVKNISMDISHSSSYRRFLLFSVVFILVLRVCIVISSENISYIYLSKALKEEETGKRYSFIEKSVFFHENAHAYYEKGNIEILKGDNEKAIESYSKALTLSGQSAIRKCIAEIFLHMSDYERAYDFYEQAWKNDPFDIENLRKIAEISEKLDETGKDLYNIDYKILYDEIVKRGRK